MATTSLRERMLIALRIRNMSPRTERIYIDLVARFALHFHRSPGHDAPKPWVSRSFTGRHATMWKMKTIIRHDDMRIAGRNQSRLTDRAWWSAVAKQPLDRIALTTRADGTFDHVEIDTPDDAAVETLNYVLSRLDS